MTNNNYHIQTLGQAKYPSPLTTDNFVADTEKVLLNIKLDNHDAAGIANRLEAAGARKKIFFNPVRIRAATVTCGGLCPGINDVIRAIVMELYYRYGVKKIFGVRYGLQGFIKEYGHDFCELTPKLVEDIHMEGGSILSSSRGSQDIKEIVNTLVDRKINMLFCIGGDGTMRATELITEEISRRKCLISVIGIPKTIDNDLQIIDKSFGFDTAIAQAAKVIKCAHIEAKGSPWGIGLIKLMGRLSGHIAVGATLANADVNFVLIPELPFTLEGKRGVFAAVEKRLKERKHCVIIVAEGAGQDLLVTQKSKTTDVSGNIRLMDIGVFLQEQMEKYFSKKSLGINIKYFNPSYIIRSIPANTADSIYCGALGQYAVHAGMAGKTAMLVGMVNAQFVHLPLKEVSAGSRVDMRGSQWTRVIEATGQPLSFI